MATAQLSYADPVRLDPLPALRRIRTLGVAWCLLVLCYGAIQLIETVYWPYEGGGWAGYLERPLWVYAELLGAVLLALAVLAWGRPDRDRRNVLAAGLSLLAAATPLVIYVGRVTSYDAGLTLFLVVGEFTRFALLAALPLAFAWAAVLPQRFTAVRLSAVSALSMLFFAGFAGAAFPSLLTSISPLSSEFWRTLFTLQAGWINALIEIVCALLAAGLFAAGMRRLRAGRPPTTSILASWLLLALILWLCASRYIPGQGPWELNGWMRALGTASNGLYLLMLLSAGLAFLLPLRPARYEYLATRHAPSCAATINTDDQQELQRHRQRDHVRRARG